MGKLENRGRKSANGPRSTLDQKGEGNDSEEQENGGDKKSGYHARSITRLGSLSTEICAGIKIQNPQKFPCGLPDWN